MILFPTIPKLFHISDMMYDKYIEVKVRNKSYINNNCRLMIRWEILQLE